MYDEAAKTIWRGFIYEVKLDFTTCTELFVFHVVPCLHHFPSSAFFLLCVGEMRFFIHNIHAYIFGANMSENILKYSKLFANSKFIIHIF